VVVCIIVLRLKAKQRQQVMKETIQSYIDACDSNIAKYMLIEDKEERERALDAIYVMKAEFEKTLAELQ